jgi:hypothetical protein
LKLKPEWWVHHWCKRRNIKKKNCDKEEITTITNLLQCLPTDVPCDGQELKIHKTRNKYKRNKNGIEKESNKLSRLYRREVSSRETVLPLK